MLYLLELEIGRVPKKVSVKVCLQSTVSAITAYRASDTSKQPGHCDAFVSLLCKFPLRVVFNKQANKLYSVFGTCIEEPAWEVWIEREVFLLEWPTKEIQSGPC
jgi:hypothetical protein